MGSQKHEQDQHDYTTRSRADTDRNSTQAPLDEQLQTVSLPRRRQSVFPRDWLLHRLSKPKCQPWTQFAHTKLNELPRHLWTATDNDISGSKLPRPTRHLQSLSRAHTPFFPFLCQLAHEPFTPA